VPEGSCFIRLTGLFAPTVNHSLVVGGNRIEIRRFRFFDYCHESIYLDLRKGIYLFRTLGIHKSGYSGAAYIALLLRISDTRSGDSRPCRSRKESLHLKSGLRARPSAPALDWRHAGAAEA